MEAAENFYDRLGDICESNCLKHKFTWEETIINANKYAKSNFDDMQKLHSWLQVDNSSSRGDESSFNGGFSDNDDDDDSMGVDETPWILNLSKLCVYL